MTSDKSGMLSVLESFPQQCKEGLALPKGFLVKGEIKNIVVCGMGGSAIGGDLLKSYLHDSKLAVFVNKDYSLPAFVDSSTLVFAVSYSGNTEETLSAVEEAKRRNAKIVAITSGGKLAKEFKAIIVPSGLQPRAAVGYLFFPMIGVLYNSGLIDVKNEDLNEMLTLIKDHTSIKAIAENLAKKIEGKLPMIYSSDILSPAAYRFKTQINENAKYSAYNSIFPEMNHNEILAYSRSMSKDRFVAILIRDPKDHPRVQKRMDICKELMSERVDVAELNVKGNSLLARLFYTIVIGDFTSYYLALRERVDPTPVRVIEWLKKKLA